MTIGFFALIALVQINLAGGITSDNMIATGVYMFAGIALGFLLCSPFSKKEVNKDVTTAIRTSNKPVHFRDIKYRNIKGQRNVRSTEKSLQVSECDIAMRN